MSIRSIHFTLLVTALCIASVRGPHIVATATTATTFSHDSAHAIRAAHGAYLSLGLRPSHHARYQAVVDAAALIAVDTAQRWVVRFTTRRMRRVANADVSARVWMPDTGVLSARNIRGRYLGAGQYEFRDIRFTQPGHWNVALVVDGTAGVDSLAFNVVLPH